MERRAKTTLLAAALLFGVLGGLIAWQTLHGHRADGSGAVERRDALPRASGGKDGLSAPAGSGATEARLDVGSERPPSERHVASTPQRPAVASVSKLRTLRIHVRWPESFDVDPDGLDVRVTNLTGALYEPRRAAEADFEVGEIKPGTYITLARATNSATATARVEVSDEGPPAEVTLVLAPARFLRVRWRTDVANPVLSIRERPELERWDWSQLRLEVFATVSEPDAKGPPSVVIDALQSISNVNTNDGSKHSVGRWLEVEPRAHPHGRAVTPDTFGFLRLAAGETPWISAWMCGALVARARVDPEQDDVLLVTPEDTLGLELGSVSFTVLDDVTGQPLAGAELQCGSSFLGEKVVADSLGQVQSPLLAPGRTRGRIAGPGYLNRSLDFVVRSGARTDLGIVRLRRMDDCLSARFATFDESHAPLAGVEFELVACEGNGADAADPDVHRAESRATDERGRDDPPSALVSFRNLRRSHYRLQIESSFVHAEPLLLAPDQLDVPGRARTIDVVVRRAFTVGFVVDPPRRGCQIRLRSTNGLAFRTLDVNEFGVGTTTLSFGSYRLDLLADGRVVRRLGFTVDREPAVVEIGP